MYSAPSVSVPCASPKAASELNLIASPLSAACVRVGSALTLAPAFASPGGDTSSYARQSGRKEEDCAWRISSLGHADAGALHSTPPTPVAASAARIDTGNLRAR